jgi:ribosome recycling factor
MQLVIPLPPLTKETRLGNQKKVKELGEKQKITVRHIRQRHMKLIKSAAKDDPSISVDVIARAEKDVEKEIKSALADIDKVTDQVKDDIMKA